MVERYLIQAIVAEGASMKKGSYASLTYDLAPIALDSAQAAMALLSFNQLSIIEVISYHSYTHWVK